MKGCEFNKISNTFLKQNPHFHPTSKFKLFSSDSLTTYKIQIWSHQNQMFKETQLKKVEEFSQSYLTRRLGISRTPQQLCGDFIKAFKKTVRLSLSSQKFTQRVSEEPVLYLCDRNFFV